MPHLWKVICRLLRTTGSVDRPCSLDGMESAMRIRALRPIISPCCRDLPHGQAQPRFVPGRWPNVSRAQEIPALMDTGLGALQARGSCRCGRTPCKAVDRSPPNASAAITCDGGSSNSGARDRGNVANLEQALKRGLPFRAVEANKTLSDSSAGAIKAAPAVFELSTSSSLCIDVSFVMCVAAALL